MAREGGFWGVTNNAPFGFSLDAYFLFLCALIPVIGVTLWYVGREKRLERQRFLGQWDHSQLRMSPFQIGLVYRLVEEAETEVIVIPVWNNQAPILNANAQRLTPGQLMPFDEARFY